MVAKLTNGTITDPINRALIEALWHSSVPLSAERYVSEYTEHRDSSTYVEVISSRLAGLEGAAVAKVDHVEDGQSFYVLAGVNASEAVRRLGLAGDGRRGP